MLSHELALIEANRQPALKRLSQQPQTVIERQMQLSIPPRSTVAMRHLLADHEQIYFLYWPKRAREAAPVLVTVHGISRNAFEHISAFAELADRYGAVLVAPLFTKNRFSDYQRLGRCGRRADHTLDQILIEVKRLTDADTERIHLFGYSGGAQFAHRYAMAYPDRVKAAGVAAAGWYTFPDPELKYPYGIQCTTNLLALCFEPLRLLRVPMHVWVGERDIKRDTALRQSERVNHQQGVSRVERAQRWVAAMRTAAQQANLETPYSMTLLPRSNHSFSRCVKHGQLVQRVFNALFESEAYIYEQELALTA